MKSPSQSASQSKLASDIQIAKALLRKVPLQRLLDEQRKRQEQAERDTVRRSYERLRRQQARRGGLLEFVKSFWDVLEPATKLVDGWPLEAICLHLEAVTFGEVNRLLINVPPGFMKAIDCETPVLTTWGWKRHGDLRPNDFVFGPDGHPRRVEAVTEHKSETAYEIEFDDETKIVAGAGHLWDVERDFPYGGPGSTRTRRSMVVTTPELIASVKGRVTQRPDRIPLCGPIEFPPRRLLIDPYLLGAWLGDGATLSGVLYCAEQDREHFEKLGSVRATVKSEGRQNFHRIGIEGFQTKLRVLGLLGNKHIPDDYLEASVEQRLELLRGLMDTDGHASKTSGTCSYTTKLRHLADQIIALLCSLSIKANLKESWSSIGKERFGPYWVISFTAPAGMRVFSLERKQAKVRPATNARSRGRYVKAVKEVGERWINCIQVEGGLYVVGKRLVITHNSLLVNVFWPAWEWGPMNMPHLRYLAFSYALHLTMRDNDKLVRLVSSPRYRELWGDRFDLVKTGAHKPENDRTGYKFATSIEGVGTGERGDRVVLDDPHNVIKIDSQGVMEKTIAFFRTSMSNRLNDMSRSAIVVVMQRLSETDVSGNILEREANYCHLCVPMEFESARYPVDHDGTTVLYDGNSIGWIDPRALDDDGNLVNVQELALRDGELAWPKRFSRNVIENDIKLEQGPTSYNGQYQQSPVNLKGGVFVRDWWQPYEIPTEGARAGKFPDLDFVVVSVDPAFTEKEENDPTGCTTWGVYQDEEEMPRLILLAAWRKHLQIHGPEQPPQGLNESVAKYQARCLPHWGLVEMVAYSATRFGGADAVLIEAKGSGLDVINEIKRLYKDEKWGVVPIKPNKDKLARALAVQPIIAGGMVYAPYGETGFKDWADLVINEMALFPKGRFKDLTDSATQAWKWLREQGLIRRPDEIMRQLEFEKSYEYVKSTRKKVLYHA